MKLISVLLKHNYNSVSVFYCFRYVYAHLYTVTATVGLIIITVIFSVVLVGAYLPNDDYDPPDTNLRIRVSRTERVEVQQQQ